MPCSIIARCRGSPRPKNRIRRGRRRWCKAGVKVLHIPFDRDGLIDLTLLLMQLRELKIRSLMVEGGAQIITSFLKHRLVDQLVLTMAPVYIGGMQAVWPLQLNLSIPPALRTWPGRCADRTWS